MRPEKPYISGAASPDQVDIKFDESLDSGVTLSHKKPINLAQSEDNLMVRESVERQRKHFTQAKKIEELELELALAKERLMIGSQIVRNLVTETKDSLTYLVQSFDLITKARGIGEGKKAK